jgi:hypothetical protein
MPGPESLDDPRSRSGAGPGAVATAAAAVALPSGPCLSSSRTVPGEIWDPWDPPDAEGGPPVEADPPVEAAPDPPDPDSPVGLFPPTPGTLSLYWSIPELPGGTS